MQKETFFFVWQFDFETEDEDGGIGDGGIGDGSADLSSFTEIGWTIAYEKYIDSTSTYFARLERSLEID